MLLGAFISAFLLLVGVGLSQGSPKPSFQDWLVDLRREALSKGISRETLDLALKDLRPMPEIIRRDRSQPEFSLTLEQYLKRMITEKSVREGRDKLCKHGNLLRGIAGRYGVQPEFVVALWGIETRYGKRTGGFPVVAALATLAYDGRRSSYFRGELLNALKILDQGHISLREMNGSWAGAMGQVQFMPSSFKAYAVDHDGDGRTDIWGSEADALASAANYLARSGWRRDETWGREVSLPQGFNREFVSPKIRRPVREWRRMGVSGRGLSQAQDMEAWVVQPDGKGGRAFLAYPNYGVILKWNRSNFFAIAVGTLADRLGAKGK